MSNRYDGEKAITYLDSISSDEEKESKIGQTSSPYIWTLELPRLYASQRTMSFSPRGPTTTPFTQRGN